MIVALLAVVLFVLYGVHHRAELGAIYDQLHQALSLDSQAEAAQPARWMRAGPMSIDPQELAGLDIETMDRSDDDYERDEFGDGWANTGSGCDTRDRILERDLSDISFERGSDCDVAGGTLHDPYTGTMIKGKLSETVQVDHIVPLAGAWFAGAEQWSAQERERFANDPDNLVAVDAAANSSKSDNSISGWYPRWPAPDRSTRCRYAAQYVHVLAEYELRVSGDDFRLLMRLETDCQRIP